MEEFLPVLVMVLMILIGLGGVVWLFVRGRGGRNKQHPAVESSAAIQQNDQPEVPADEPK
jgi:cbb3-type cytochrome oxidase subunit 3